MQYGQRCVLMLVVSQRFPGASVDQLEYKVEITGLDAITWPKSESYLLPDFGNDIEPSG